MKNALIDPTTNVQFISSWVTDGGLRPVFQTYANSARVCEISATPNEVAPPLFWTPCAEGIIADQWYYDTVGLQFLPVVNAPVPMVEQSQPTQTGAETF